MSLPNRTIPGPIQQADYECVHGRLPGDSSYPCGCWSSEDIVPVIISLADGTELAALARTRHTTVDMLVSRVSRWMTEEEGDRTSKPGLLPDPIR